MGQEDSSDRGRHEFDGEHAMVHIDHAVDASSEACADRTGDRAGMVQDLERELLTEPLGDRRQALRDVEALYGRELGKARNRMARWRERQAREAFRIGDMWTTLSERLTARQVGAFLASECQIPRQDVRRYVRLSKVLGTDREFFIEHGVAVSVLLDLAGQDEIVRNEAVRMIRSGRALQAKELRGLKRDIGLARAAASGELDKTRIRELRNAAARKARAAADAWIASLETLANQAFDVSEQDKFKGNAAQNAARKIDRMASRAAKLVEDLPAIVGRDFAKAPKPTAAPVAASRDGWPRLLKTLRDISKGRMFTKTFYERPETTVYEFNHNLVWQLAWPFGYDEDTRPTVVMDRMRQSGAVPLQTGTGDASARSNPPARPTVLEICAGAGGQAIGLDAAGFRHVGLVEIDADATATIRHNRPEWPVQQADLRGLDLSAFEGVDLLAGGVPCQPYSAAGKKLGAHDERDLFPEALKLVRKLKPKAVMLENVTGTQNVGNAVNRLRILSQLSSLGYDAEWRILDGTGFGLPQKRRRAVLVAFRPGNMHRFHWPEALSKEAPTVGESLYDLMAANDWPHVEAWKDCADSYAPTLIGGSQNKKGIDLAQRKSRESWLALGVDPNGRARQAPGPDAPADRMPKLTLDMMARLQGFPKGWEFKGPDLQQFHQIANAFPPAMAQSVGLSIIRALEGTVAGSADLRRLFSPLLLPFSSFS